MPKGHAHLKTHHVGRNPTVVDVWLFIEEARLALGLSINDFESACGLPWGSLLKIKRGSYEIRTLNRILEFLDGRLDRDPATLV